jgi:hypothetical protein
MSAAAGLSFTPWIYAVWQASKINADLSQNIGWMSRPTPGIIFQFVFDVIEPFYFQQSSDEPASRFLITVPLLLLIAVAKLLFFAGWKNEADKRGFYLLGVLTAIPIMIAFVASWVLPFSIWGSRHLIIVYAPMIILTAKFLTELKIPSVKILFSSLIILLFGIALTLQLKSEQAKFIWCGWEALARNIDADKGHKIYVFEDLTAYHFWFATRKNNETPQIFKVENVEGVAEDKAYFLPRGFDGINTIDENGIAGERFWIAFRATVWDQAKPPLGNFVQKGYRLAPPIAFEVKGQKAFLVEAER